MEDPDAASKRKLDYKEMSNDAENKVWKAHPTTETILDKIEQIHMLERELVARNDRIKRLEKDLVDAKRKITDSENENTRLSSDLTITWDKVRELKDRLKYYGHTQL